MKKTLSNILTIGTLILFVIMAVATSEDIIDIELKAEVELDATDRVITITNRDDFDYKDVDLIVTIPDSLAVNNQIVFNTFRESIQIGQQLRVPLSSFTNNNLPIPETVLPSEFEMRSPISDNENGFLFVEL